MKELQINLNLSPSTESYEIKDALNIVLLDIKHDLLEKQIKTNLTIKHSDAFSLTLNNESINFTCECQDNEKDCHCSIEEIIRRQIFKQLGILGVCGCGENCGCH